MFRRSRLAGLIACGIAAALAIGCDGPELGTSPFLCNDGLPRCPDGYFCENLGTREVCVREGSSLATTLGQDAGRTAHTDADPAPGMEAGARAEAGRVGDSRAVASDGPSPTADQGSTPVDQGTVTPPPPPPRLGCSGNGQCSNDNKTKPCCCLIVPFPVQVWQCTAYCVNPLSLCFG